MPYREPNLLPEAEGTGAASLPPRALVWPSKARLTVSITASTQMLSMQYGSRQRILGYGVCQG